MDERGLVERVGSGDPAAQRELYDANVDRVYRLAFRMTCDETLARDLTQEAFIRVFERIRTFRGESALSTWVHAVTTSVVLNGIRKAKRFREREIDLEAARSLRARTWEAEPDLKVRLRRAIDELPEGYRTVFVLHDVEGYKHEEIAEALGVTTGTTKAQLSRARARLREELADFAREWAS